MEEVKDRVSLSQAERIGIFLVGFCLFSVGLFFIVMFLLGRFEGNIGLGIPVFVMSLPILNVARIGKRTRAKLLIHDKASAQFNRPAQPIESSRSGYAIKFIKYAIYSALIGYVVFIPAYSILWMSPHADSALKQFKQSAVVGMKFEAVKDLATEVGADEFYSFEPSPSESGTTKIVVVSFHTFIGGLSRHVCQIGFNNEIATTISYGFSG